MKIWICVKFSSHQIVEFLVIGGERKSEAVDNRIRGAIDSCRAVLSLSDDKSKAEDEIVIII